MATKKASAKATTAPESSGPAKGKAADKASASSASTAVTSASAKPARAKGAATDAPAKGKAAATASAPKPAPAKVSAKAAAEKAPAKAAAEKAPAKAAAEKAPTTTAAKAPTKAAAEKAPAASASGGTPAKAAPTKAAPAKAAPAKAAPAKSATKNGAAADGRVLTTTPFDKAFLKQQRDALQSERARYLHSAQTYREEADSLMNDREPGDVQFDEESGEGDTLAVERERDLALSAQAQQAVEEIDAALERIANNTYGICRVSGMEIPRERLEAIPWATERVEYKAGGLGRR